MMSMRQRIIGYTAGRRHSFRLQQPYGLRFLNARMALTPFEFLQDLCIAKNCLVYSVVKTPTS